MFLCRRWGTNWWRCAGSFDTRIPEMAIEVPKISSQAPCALRGADGRTVGGSADDHILFFPFAADYGAERRHSSSGWCKAGKGRSSRFCPKAASSRGTTTGATTAGTSTPGKVTFPTGTTTPGMTTTTGRGARVARPKDFPSGQGSTVLRGADQVQTALGGADHKTLSQDRDQQRFVAPRSTSAPSVSVSPSWAELHPEASAHEHELASYFDA